METFTCETNSIFSMAFGWYHLSFGFFTWIHIGARTYSLTHPHIKWTDMSMWNRFSVSRLCICAASWGRRSVDGGIEYKNDAMNAISPDRVYTHYTISSSTQKRTENIHTYTHFSLCSVPTGTAGCDDVKTTSGTELGCNARIPCNGKVYLPRIWSRTFNSN